MSDAVPRVPTPSGVHPRVRCPECGRSVKVRKDRSLMRHGSPICPGSYEWIKQEKENA